ncbi:hypothetical protein KFE25_009893 [Diacronema lutheri]|uniref:AP2/ERF domain-containing protein n=1 Tax=Diacronema lutheri TaxID=2081491 RepID=A0A8J6CC89_DIALT|nr:hypothetical protein KFE25_009893 [Diacronema lutheri]
MLDASASPCVTGASASVCATGASSPCPSHVVSDLGAPGSSVCSDTHSDQTGTSRKRRKYDIKYKGVYACKVSGGNFWQAQISICGNTHHLGVFSTAEEAARAYDEQARVLHPRRKMNFPDEDPTAGRTGLPAVAPQPTLLAPAAHAHHSLPQHCVPAPDSQPSVPAAGSFWSGPCWVNDLDDEKVAAFWRGALVRGVLNRSVSSPSTSADETMVMLSPDMHTTGAGAPVPNFSPAPNRAAWHVLPGGRPWIENALKQTQTQLPPPQQYQQPPPQRQSPHQPPVVASQAPSSPARAHR